MGDTIVWTDEQIEILTRLWCAGEAPAVIACEILKSKNAILGKAFRLGLTMHPKAKVKRRRKNPRNIGAQGGGGVPLAQVRHDGCLYPVATEGDRQHYFCNERRTNHRSYCEYHASACYRGAREQLDG